MKRFSLRVRLAVASAIAVLIVMAIAGVLEFVVVRSQAIGQVDGELGALASTVEALERSDSIAGNPIPTTGANVADLLEAVSDHHRLLINIVTYVGGAPEIRDPVGNGLIPVGDLFARAEAGADPIFFSADVGGVPYRAAAGVERADNKPARIVIVARSIGDIANTLRRFGIFIAAGTILTVIVAGILGYVITRQAMVPVRRLARTAQEISATSDLGKRVEEGGDDQDLRNLSATFNEMLDSIEDAYEKIAGALEAERRFVANASHELRTPLTTIHGNIDYLARLGVADDDVVDDLQASAQRLSRLVTSLTQLAREEAGVNIEDQLIDLDGLVRDVAAEPEYRGVDMSVALDVVDDVWVRGSESSLASVVRNLLGNAFKYGGGHVDIALTVDDGRAVLDIRDNGPGLAPEEVAHVFERFWRSAEAKAKPGSGLGLSIVSSAVASHQGEVEAFAGPGGWFRVTLPVVDAPTVDAFDG